VQSLKQLSEIVARDDGNETDLSDQHPSKAHSPRIETRQPDSNANFERFLHKEKHNAEMISTDEGTQIDRSDEYL
jgi:hypothetical protein